MRTLVKGLLKENIEHKEIRTVGLLKSRDEGRILRSMPNPMSTRMCIHVHVCTHTHTMQTHTYTIL